MQHSVNFSIVIPTFKRQSLLTALLVNLIQQIDALQSRAVVEIIVVDNCPDGSARNAAKPDEDRIKYVHEPATGLANVRNRGVEEATGEFIIFIDDDETPTENWLSAFVRCADQDVDACFGPVEPVFEEPPQETLKQILQNMFSRQLKACTGDDISQSRANLGTGNSMFKKSRCFDDERPFDPRFNDGGEDVWYLRRLVEEKGVKLIWCAEAAVSEFVPVDRMQAPYLQRRTFRNGQLRCLVESANKGPRAIGRVAFWMAVGMVQSAGYFACYAATRFVNADQSMRYKIRAYAGMGKVFWWG